MSTRVTCPNCGTILRLPDDPLPAALSCPRCLASFDNPRGAASSAVQTETPASAASSVTSSRPAELGSARRLDGVDVDVYRDHRGTAVNLIVLAVLGGIGFLGAAYSKTDAGGFASGILILVVVQLVLLLIMRALWRANAAPGARTGWIVVRALFISGLVGVLFVLAVVIFLFAVCLVEGPPRFH